MWCPSCRADVAAELSKDNRRMLCARCNSELGIAAAALPPVVTPRTAEAERDARELLARWTAQNLLEPPIPSASTLMRANGADAASPKPELRFDSPRSPLSGPSAAFLAAARGKQSQFASHNSIEQPHEQTPSPRKKKRRPIRDHDTVAERPSTVAPPQAMTGAGPAESTLHRDSPPPHGPSDAHGHFDHELPPRMFPRTSWSTMAGQLCAYGGVGLLTCGTVLVMWSYFGGPPAYMPTGWLTAAVGQMLLFLGVVTLISNGMEQTIAEVTWRVDHLAEEIHHMGHALELLEQEQRQARLDRTTRRRRRDNESRDAA